LPPPSRRLSNTPHNYLSATWKDVKAKFAVLLKSTINYQFVEICGNPIGQSVAMHGQLITSGVCVVMIIADCPGCVRDAPGDNRAVITLFELGMLESLADSDNFCVLEFESRKV
jgi:hypothetical protein